jgi:glycine/D-amino acid oxidase-like deaminating enzyme
MAEKHVNYIVVGLGIGGANFCQELERRGKSFIVFDDDREAASNIAAGLINPITGRNYAKSWRIDQLIPKAIENYQWFERKLGRRFHYDLDIRRILNSVAEENKWTGRLNDTSYAKYLDNTAPSSVKNEAFITSDKVIKVMQGMRVNLIQLLSAYKNMLSLEGRCIDQTLDFDQINWDQNTYNGLSFDHVVCCEGALGQNSPFDFLPIILNLGEVLLVDLHTSQPITFAIKKKVFIVPVDNYFWVGGTYTNLDNLDNVLPDYDRLQRLFEEAYKGSYTIIDRMYGIRPTVPDRRPILGRHPKNDDLYVLNGLGTKGTSLSPLMANMLAGHIEDNNPLDPEVSIERYAR